MNYLYLGKCFLVGVSAASAIGPIFVLTFNNAALHGFFRGFCTALGAALGDGFLLFLGLLGALNVLETSTKYQIIIDFAGGILLVLFGISMLFAHRDVDTQAAISLDSTISSIVKAFVSTTINPLALFFFMFISTQILSTQKTVLSLTEIATGSGMAALGSLTVFTLVAYLARVVGNAISSRNLRILSITTGTIVIIIGGYFCIDGVQELIKLLQ